MGDRAMIAVKQDEGDALVYLYTHAGGSDLPFDVQKALAKRWRWGGSSECTAYLTRIIFDVMSKGDQGNETGFGITTVPPDIFPSHFVVVVDTKTQTVGFAKQGAEPVCLKQWTFEEYIALSADKIEEAYDNSVQVRKELKKLGVSLPNFSVTA